MHNCNEASIEDIRTAIDITALRQRLWLDAETGEPREELPPDTEATNNLTLD